MPIKSIFECDTCGKSRTAHGDVRKAFPVLQQRGWLFKGQVVCPACNIEGQTTSIRTTPLEICSDGSCVGGNPGYGGWGWSSTEGENAGPAPEYPSTNQRMEILGAIKALEENSNPVILYTDSRYVSDCFNKKWYKGWLRNGWVTSAKQPVKNEDLWKRFVNIIDKHPDLEIKWVKGHQDNKLNVRADEIARNAAENDKRKRQE